MSPDEAESGTNLADGFNWDEFLERHKLSLPLLLVGVILVSLGFLYFKKAIFTPSTKIEVLETSTEGEGNEIIVEVAGAVENPGVYQLGGDQRIEDALIAAGGLSQSADRDWVELTINRAAKLSDGQKIYIRSINEQSTTSSARNSGIYQSDTLSYSTSSEEITNINEANLSELDKLPGIGPVYGQKIIDQRPYSNIDELRSRNVIPKSTYEKIKDLITVY